MNGNTNGNGLADEADAAPTASAGDGNVHDATDDKNEALSREEQQSELDTWAAFYACSVVSLSCLRRLGFQENSPGANLLCSIILLST